MGLRRYVTGCYYYNKPRMSRVITTQKISLAVLWFFVLCKYQRDSDLSRPDGIDDLYARILEERIETSVKEELYKTLLLQDNSAAMKRYHSWARMNNQGSVLISDKGVCQGFFSYNSTASVSLPIDRETVDKRPAECEEEYHQGLNYDGLPSVSVVIPFHNEQLATLMRTVFSVLRHSPHKLLKEVILVDDFSSLSELVCLGEELEKAIFTLQVGNMQIFTPVSLLINSPQYLNITPCLLKKRSRTSPYPCQRALQISFWLSNMNIALHYRICSWSGAIQIFITHLTRSYKLSCTITSG